jgi:hypothetical protein
VKIYGSGTLQGVEGSIGSASYSATDEYGQALNNPV